MFVRKAHIALFLSLLLSFAVPALAKIIHVPAQQPTIQAGINAANKGDTVLVSAGTYYENISFSGKAITVTSASGPAVTIIDGKQAGAVVSFINAETNQSVISGFTIQDGSFGGVNIFNASPLISGNVITANCSDQGGIQADQGAPIIQGNLITDNGLAPGCTDSGGISIIYDSGAQITGNVIAGNQGGGVYIFGSSGSNHLIQQNTILSNLGPGINLYYSAGTVVQNLIAQNQSYGITWSQPPVTLVSNTIANDGSSEVFATSMNNQVTMQNNLIVGTSGQPAVYCQGYDSAPVINNDDVFAESDLPYGGACPDPTGTNGNISADPLFADLLSNNYHLLAGSPAIDVGDNSAAGLPQQDLDADPRIVNKIIDLGADEYYGNTTLTYSSYSLRYGGQDVGTSSSSQSVTLTNHSTAAIALELIATGANFSQTNNCGTSLAAGAACQISVVFSPINGGSLNGALGVFTSATQNPQTVSLNGIGLAPQFQFNAYFNFYGQVIGTSNTQTGTLTNVGQAPMMINSIVYSGPTDFVETNNCPVVPKTLAPQASCTVSVTYTPTLVGYENGTITFNDNALPGPQTASVSGSSVSAGVPTLNPTSLTFPTTLIGQSSAPQTATLTNTGTGALGIQNIYSYNDFVETNDCPASLAVGNSCTITVVYTPSSQGTEYGYVYIYTDSAYNTQLSMTGTGQAPVPTISSLSLPSVPAGSSDTQITITGTGFVYGSKLVWNGIPLSTYTYPYGSTQLNVTIPAANLTIAGTYQISVFTPAPGGGTSNSLPFTVYTPINYAAGSAKYSYRTITGTNLNLYYYAAAALTAPFPIQFGGGSYTNLTIGAAGTISFNGFASEYNDVIPTTQTPMLIAPFWAALDPFGSGTDNNVFWDVTGTAPNRELVVEWRDVTYCCNYDTQDTVKFEVVFFEGSSNILFNYADTVFGGQYSADDNGATASVGVQVAPNVGTQFSYYAPSLKSNTALLWYPGSPTATLSSSSLGFGYHQIGSKSLAQKVTLTNGGQVPLVISSITTGNPDFTQLNTCGASLKAGKSCKIRVFFTPSQPSSETATLTITDNATNSPQTASLTGIGTITPIVVYPIMANFGSVPVGTTSTLPVVLANAANRALSIQQIATTPSVYTETNNCGASLAAGASCTVSVTFAPVQQGNVTGKLSMALNGKPAVDEVKLVGSGK